MISYTDDKAVLCKADSWAKAERLTNVNLIIVHEWVGKNKLSLNIMKTVYMTFIIYKDKLLVDLRIVIKKLSNMHAL